MFTASVAKKCVRTQVKGKKVTKRQYTAMHDVIANQNKGRVADWHSPTQLGQEAFAWVDNELVQPYSGAIPGLQGGQAAPKEVQVGVLQNGTRIVAHDSSSPLKSISIVLQAGSRFEEFSTQGSGHFLRRLALLPNEKKYHYNMIRDMQAQGVRVNVKNTKEHIVYTGSAIGEELPLATLYDTLGGIWQPRLEEWEVLEAAKFVRSDVDEVTVKDQVLDGIHREAFRGQGLANGTTVSPSALDNVNNHYIRHFTNTYYNTNRMIVVAQGLDMELLAAVVGEFFAAVPAKEQIVSFVGGDEPWIYDYFPKLWKPRALREEKTSYIGGSAFVLPEANGTQVAVAYKGFGYNQGIEKVLLNEVLKAALGGGVNTTRGRTPGHGRTAKLGALLQDGVSEASSFAYSYSDAGLLGGYVATEGGRVNASIQSLRSSLSSLSSLSKEEVERAKNVAKLNWLQESQCSSRFARVIAQQIALSGSALTPEVIAAKFDALTYEAVIEGAKEVLKSSPVLSLVGDTTGYSTF